MAVTRNNLSMKMNGRVGAYTFYTTTGGRQVARVANNGSNYGESAKRTVAMQTRRTKWGNVVSFFRQNKDLMARAFERKSANLSDYNRFMQLNIPIASVALTRDDFLKGACILQAYTIADGSLPEISSSLLEEDGFAFDLLTTLDGEFDNYTIGDISINLMDNNPQILEGDQLTFINWTNAGTMGGGIRLYRHLVEITIDRNSSMPFSNLRFSNIVASNGSKVIIQGSGPVYGQAIIHSRSVGGNLLVSPTKIALNSTTFVEQFSDAAALKKAIDSYGVDADKLLEPGSADQKSPQPIPSLATISAVFTPEAAGSLEIIDNETQERFQAPASFPVGKSVKLNFAPNFGYTLAVEPNPADRNNYIVEGSVAFKVTGTTAG